jgi:alpha-galactosidase
MNRCLTEVAGGETFHKYVLGVYNLYQRLTKTFPTILFEGCSSGGSRFDIGILQYAPQSWLSDDTDALERILLQEGASYIYPQSSWGAHVSITPNHQTGRSTPIMFRAIVAFFGAFGYELDPAKLSPEEKEAVKEQIAFYKKYRSLFQRGDFYRLKTVQNAELPFPSLVASNDWAAWQVVKNTECAKAPAESAVAYFRLLYHPARLLRRLKLKGLDPNATYQVSLWEEAGYNPEDKQLNCRTWTGEELMQAGLFLDAGQRPGDFMAELFLVNRI